MGLKTSSIYNDSLTLLTDFYQLTMVYGYWKSGMSERRAVFHLNFRKKPFNGNFAIAAGLQTAIDFIQAFKFSESDLDYLRSLNAFEPEFLTFLSNFKFPTNHSYALRVQFGKLSYLKHLYSISSTFNR
jgi:nicotinate phosphoribosyltransferase